MMELPSQAIKGFDIEAEISFLSSEEGGRTKPAYTGFRPPIYYDDPEMGWDAMYDWGTEEPIQPGATVHARISFLSSEAHRGRLYPGKEFELREGSRVVGRGRVTRLLELENEG
jgi:translation elongation factor EF-Tu-like GTPase